MRNDLTVIAQLRWARAVRHDQPRIRDPETSTALVYAGFDLMGYVGGDN
jgi:hypothetical protein